MQGSFLLASLQLGKVYMQMICGLCVFIQYLVFDPNIIDDVMIMQY